MRLIVTVALLFCCLPVAQAAVRVYDGEGAWQRSDARGTLQASYALWFYRETKRRDFRLQLRVGEEESHDFSVTIVPRGAALSAASRHVSRFDLHSTSSAEQDSEEQNNQEDGSEEQAGKQQKVGTGTCSHSGYEQTCELEFTVAGHKITLRKVFKPKRRSALRTLLTLSGTLTKGDSLLQWSSDLVFNLDRSVACSEQPQTCARQNP